MKKKTQMIMWIVIAVIMLAILALIVANIIIGKTHKIENPVATFEVEGYGNIKIELYPEYAPNTVLNFINLINKGYYNGKVFYGKDTNAIYASKTAEGTETVPTMSLVDSAVEAGSEKDFEYQIDGEFVANDFEANILRHEKGIVSMVREDYPAYFGLTEQGNNSASDGFRILMDTNRNLNGVYTAFGKVVEGMDIVEKIFAVEEVVKTEEEEETAVVEIAELSAPAVITKATVETYGVEYDLPEVHEAFDYEAYLQNYFQSYSGATE